MNELHGNVYQTLDALVRPDDIHETIGNLPKGKACRFDNMYYEHLIPIRDLVSPVLAYVYTWMLRRSFMPDSLKRGVIITLHKGGRERKDDPNNYRAITLTSVLLKLYEMVLLHRCKSNMLKGLSTQQGGFQEHLGCTITSFVVRECIYFTHEQHSKLYVCFLDGKQAFDRV
mgnify:CR=1 FL=1